MRFIFRFIFLLLIFLCKLWTNDSAVDDVGCFSALRKKFCMVREPDNAVFTIKVIPPSPKSTKSMPNSFDYDPNFLSTHSASSARLLPNDGESQITTSHPFAIADKREKIIIDPKDMRVLIADSQKFIYYTLRLFCENNGVEDSNIVLAENGADAIHAFKKLRPHLIFIDQNIASSDFVVSNSKTVILRDGFDTILKIRKYQDEVCVNPVIIGVLEEQSQKTIDAFSDAGADSIFQKPFTRGSSASLSLILDDFFEFFDF